jgi:hypothetical protein
MNAKVVLLSVLFAVPLFSHAQAFKCRTPSGKVEFSDSPCAGGAQTERVQSNEYISPERQRQAREVQARNASEVERIEGEKAAYNQQLQRQQAAYARADAEQARIDANKKASENLKHQQDECSKLSRRTDMPQSQRAALDEICGKPIPDKDRFDDCKEKLARASNSSQRAVIAASCTGDANSVARVQESSRRRMDSPEPEAPAPLSIIKNCNGATCTDQTGQRYTTQAGKTVRSDGKRCHQQGSAMYCD